MPSMVTLVFGFVEAIVITRAIALTLRVGFGAGCEVGGAVAFGVADGEIVGFGVADPEAEGCGVGDDDGCGVGTTIGLGLIVTFACTVLDCEKFPAGNCVAVIVAEPGPTTTIEAALKVTTFLSDDE